MEGRAIRIQGDAALIEEIAALVAASDEAEDVEVEQAEAGSIGADFALETVAAMVAIVHSLFFAGPIVPKLFRLFRKHQGTRVTIETPTRSVTIEVNGQLSEEALSRTLAELATG